ncbi:hypothetical protein VNO78_32106 [Psophocarpus tetragonolobus]|uniref:Uncharacterized protein n=1 Tax=Psophocarpus tetragonolobus TaxID=3891 RepID=A0AAN9RZR0_PSOTE
MLYLEARNNYSGAVAADLAFLPHRAVGCPTRPTSCTLHFCSRDYALSFGQWMEEFVIFDIEWPLYFGESIIRPITEFLM